jgi:5'-deoxy-5'-methylthioadenosine phosphorylase
MFGVIGGTGLGKIEGLVVEKYETIKTPYGETSEPLAFGSIAGQLMIAFIARHGKNHSIPPHLINYQANIWALHSVGVKNIIAINTVGSIDTRFLSGHFVFPDQVIDYTYCRKNTFFDGVNNPVKHIDFTYPFDNNLRNHFSKVSRMLELKYHTSGVYACVQGPRLESASEINRYENDGADIIGMTGMPEASLAREIGLNYALICPVANHAAGRGLNKDGISHEEISANSKKMALNIENLIKGTIGSYGN